MVLTNAEQTKLSKLYEPILYFHPEETHLPIHPEQFMIESAMWCNKPPRNDRKSWGNCEHKTNDPFPRSPLIPLGSLSVDPDDLDSNTQVYIGKPAPDDDSFRPYLVSNGERELFLQTRDLGWGQGGPDQPIIAEIAAEHFFSGAPFPGRDFLHYMVDVRDQDSAPDIPIGADTPIPPGWQGALQSAYPNGYWLITYLYLFAYHEEELAHCEKASEHFRARRTGDPVSNLLNGSYAGDWQAFTVLVPNPGQPADSSPGSPTHLPSPLSPLDIDEDDFPLPDSVGFSRRARGALVNVGSNVVESAEFSVMKVIDTDGGDLRRIGNHVKTFVAKGTHNYYAGPGEQNSPKFDDKLPIPINIIDQCLLADSLEAGAQKVEETQQKAENIARQVLVGVSKIGGGILLGALGGPAGAIVGAFLGAMAAVAEGLGGAGPDTLPPFYGPDEVPDHPSDSGTYGLVLVPPDLHDQLAEELAEEAKSVVTLATGQALRIVDRDRQIWWQPDGTHPFGYEGRWGVMCERDPFNRRSGSVIPYFEANFINAYLTSRA